jgi:hypothetical protein
VPRDWRELKSEGTLPGTDPLYYHKADYEIVMWGSLTRTSVRSMDIDQDTVKRVVITALDPDYFPSACHNKECIGSNCPLYAWLLARCNYKRKNQTRQNQHLRTSPLFFYFKFFLQPGFILDSIGFAGKLKEWPRTKTEETLTLLFFYSKQKRRSNLLFFNSFKSFTLIQS